VVGNNNTRKLSVAEFRGFALADEYAPLIFINSQDSKAAQIFTLAHELVHIWLGSRSVSNHPINFWSSKATNEIERFCNKCAAELLVPEDQFALRWKGGEDLESRLQSTCRHFRVSSLVILRRALELQYIDQTEFQDQYDRENAKIKEYADKKAERSRGSFYPTFFARHSNRFTLSVVASAAEGRLPYRHAASLLGVKVKTVVSLSSKLSSEAA